ncbi:MAG TPA: glycine/sarcosine/betaine reductase complex component C subunit beta [Egibacteraceae bacterium]|nr:glycine/sarcosine/betaine reductase complex component C subunit beta [Egibacteraceae bacterium]
MIPVVTGTSAVLAHAPGLARHGSKPSRELARDDAVRSRFLASLRSFDEAVGYSPHQAYLGALHPRELPARPRTGQRVEGAERFAAAGELLPEEEFLGLLALADDFDLITLDPAVAEDAAARLARHPLAKAFDLDKVTKAAGDAERAADQPGALPLHIGADRLAGAIQRGHEADEALTAPVLLENLAGKATGFLALAWLLHGHGIDPGAVDYVLGCSEEAVGDRYQRGGGNLAKAIAETAGLANASGADVKNFCAAPIPALVIAGSLVASGVCRTVAVVAGGSLPKLGMKFQGHLKHGLPVLEDVLGGMAALVTADDGASPHLRLDVVGRHPVSAGSANQSILTALTVEPLERVGLRMVDVDDYATELHDPEVTEPQGSGDVAARNYKTIAALAVRRGEIERGDMGAFAAERGMPGFAPTQGHLASALCYLPHALRRLTAGDANRVQLLAKGSLFLGRMSRSSDGMSVVLERNPRVTGEQA